MVEKSVESLLVLFIVVVGVKNLPQDIVINAVKAFMVLYIYGVRLAEAFEELGVSEIVCLSPVGLQWTTDTAETTFRVKMTVDII